MEKTKRIFRMFIGAIVLLTMVSCGGGGGGSVASANPATEDAAISEYQELASTAVSENVSGGNETTTETADNESDDAETGGVEIYESSTETVDETISETDEATEEVAQAFRMVIIPDSQHATVDFPEIFETQLLWIVENKDTLGIEFVLHEGDTVHYNDETGYQNASSSYELIDGVVPHALAVGNHEMSTLVGRGTELFNTYFPVSRYSGYENFGGSYPEDTLDNSYHFFTAGGIDWLVISLAYNPLDSEIAWAKSIAEGYLERRIIVVTHAFLNEDSEIGNEGEDLWNDFLGKNENVLMVFNGHYTDGETGRAILTGDNGNSVYAMFANYQKRRPGGQGYVRILTVNPVAGTISVETYSPWYDSNETDEANQFEFTGVAF